MKFLDWFDINNIEHLKAYDHLRKTGVWPKGFIPEDITGYGYAELAFKMANTFVDEKLANQIKHKNGEPCEHPGCIGHRKHPCGVCGRFGALGDVFESGKIVI